MRNINEESPASGNNGKNKRSSPFFSIEAETALLLLMNIYLFFFCTRLSLIFRIFFLIFRKDIRGLFNINTFGGCKAVAIIHRFPGGKMLTARTIASASELNRLPFSDIFRGLERLEVSSKSIGGCRYTSIHSRHTSFKFVLSVL